MSRHGHLSIDPSIRSKSRPASEIIRRVWKYLVPYRGMALGTILCAIVSLAFSFAFPLLTTYVIDDVVRKNNFELLTPVMLALIAAFFLRDAFNALRIRINNTFEQNVIFDMRREVYARLQRLPAGYFDQRASGDLMTRVIEDVNSVERLLIDGTEQGTIAILSIAGVLTILFTMNPSLALVALIPLPLLAGGALWYTLTAHKRYRGVREASSAMNALLMDNLQGVRQIKAFAREQHEDQRFTDRAGALRLGTLEVMRAWSYYSPAMSFANALGLALVLWFGGVQVMRGEMEIGALIGFILFLNLFYEPVGRLHGLNQMLQAARAGGERVFDILDATEERAGRVARLELPRRVSGEVVYRDVAFEYATDKPVLKHVSLQARPGEMIALVGPTGAGKSTLVNLLPGFYEPSAGSISIDGIDIAQVPLEQLRGSISVVSQEPFLFNGTIRENILYGDLKASEEKLIEAAKAANCWEFISRLSEGFDTRVGERGVKLSVGEKQRVSIARALLKDAPILILDEATASVDTATERLIQEALERLLRGRTSFVIAHRLSTIRHADQILVLRQGEIVERGTHESLLEKDGLYARLARIQNTTFIEEGFARLEAAAAP